MAADFIAPTICRSTKTAPSKLLNLVCETQARGQTQHVANPTRENSVFDLAFDHGLLNVGGYALDNFPGDDHKMVTYLPHIFPRPRKSATITQSMNFYKKLANLFGLNAALRSLKWLDFVFSPGSQEVADILYPNLPLIINNLIPQRA